jgi:hypothetical protein
MKPRAVDIVVRKSDHVVEGPVLTSATERRLFKQIPLLTSKEPRAYAASNRRTNGQSKKNEKQERNLYIHLTFNSSPLDRSGTGRNSGSRKHANGKNKLTLHFA